MIGRNHHCPSKNFSRMRAHMVFFSSPKCIQLPGHSFTVSSGIRPWPNSLAKSFSIDSYRLIAVKSRHWKHLTYTVTCVVEMSLGMDGRASREVLNGINSISTSKRHVHQSSMAMQSSAKLQNETLFHPLGRCVEFGLIQKATNMHSQAHLQDVAAL